MRIVIDMQGAQTESRLRGIGRYTMSFAQAVVRNRGKHEVILALSGLLPDTIEPIRAAFDGLLPQENIRVWYAPGPVRGEHPGNESRREVAELIREAFLASLRPDVIHISTLFEGYVDDAVTSIGRFDQQTPVSVTVIELPMSLGKNGSYDKWLDRKKEFLKKITACFVVNEFWEFFNTINGNLKNHIKILINICDIEAAQYFAIWESLVQVSTPVITQKPSADRRPRLAYVTPLPPERTGISDYSAELIQELVKYYEIVVIVAQKKVSASQVTQHAEVRDVAWLKAHAGEIDRVIYHIGNSPFHAHMLPLLQEVPGVVVLHDFFLGHLWGWMDQNVAQGLWARALYSGHGYSALLQRRKDPQVAVFEYPCCFDLISNSQGVIVHSEYSYNLSKEWYGIDSSNGWEVIPHLRVPATVVENNSGRENLGFSKEDFLICSFGLLGETKLNHRLLRCWLNSSLALDTHCHLVFVGENDGNDYGVELQRIIRESGLDGRIRITGFASTEMFRQYLMAADLTVQLRTRSRGETSGTVLDCMNYSKPLIVNANGSMAELDSESVWMLPDKFNDTDLVNALETLWRDPLLRQDFGRRAKEKILAHHTPEECAKRYAVAIERFQKQAEKATPSLIKAIAEQELSAHDSEALIRLSQTIAINHPLPQPANRLFLDITVTCGDDYKTGIQRVVRSILIELISSQIEGWRVEPIRLTNKGNEWHYRLATKYVCSIMGFDDVSKSIYEEVVEPKNGDILLVLDLTGSYLISAEKAGLYSQYRNIGVKIYAVVYDLLPILMPEVFPPYAYSEHDRWARAISTFDGALCISRSVANDLLHWQGKAGLLWKDRRPFKIDWFHLGADVNNSAPTTGTPKDVEMTIAKFKSRYSFLMVGTIEPRKGYQQAISAFTQLWTDGVDVNLIIVGKEGWAGLPDEMRRDIPDTVSLLRSHPELNNRLFWLEAISDEFLEIVYGISTCLISASYGEGFGLPLIEAAQYNLPIIARDIPVFHEVAGSHVFYFKGKDPYTLVEAIRCWMNLYAVDNHPKSEDMPWLTWKESAQQLKKILLNETFKGNL